MKQEITNEKTKIRVNKSMLNFKIFSLMKKQLFSLGMLLALIIVAGTSSWAQNATSEVENTSARTYVMITGSTHTFTITQGRPGSSLQWIVYDGLNGTTVSDNADYTLVSANSTSPAFQITWAETAAGNYTVQVTETNPLASEFCSTVRRFYVNVLDFDVLVYASDDAGNVLTGDELLECGEGNTANYGNEPIGTGAGAFNNQFGGAVNAGNLVPYIGAAAQAVGGHVAYTTRHFTLAVRWNDNINVNDIPTIASLGFDFDLTSNVIAELIQVNSGAHTTGSGSTFITAPLAAAPTDIPAGLTNNTYTVYFTMPVTFRDRWFSGSSPDITATLYADQCTVYQEATHETILGEEPSAKVDAPDLVNTSATQTILLSPATSTISVD